ncbi:hypothetical protein GCM10011385_40730 [Nitratireductor aestuarii]|uniref:Glycosyltransferase family 1 protein n=1 Tax=Nitratireductor aestuarii TaxID=1735103 RepID=A0A916S3C8_9HYPH|nr:glycosyltransferase [Nitratireductor aestuarii]GGA82364.1 hypothetical protein GCM10011385_40730 [Nitratireductor aestuarii]
MPRTIRNWLEARWLGHLERAVGKRIGVVWLFENSRFFDMRFAGNRLKIYHQVDLNQDFYPCLAAETADLTIAISKPIEDRLRRNAQNLLRLTHGCVLSSADSKLPDEVEKRFGRAGVNAVMAGNLTIPYLDKDLLGKLVTKHPEVQFHFIGPYQIGYGLHKAVGTAANTIFWGLQTAEILPAFYGRADVLLVAYRADNFVDQLANPHKIMEYIASGRCVLATRTLEYEETPGVIEMALSPSEFLDKFSTIVQDPAAWNTDFLTAKRQEFAAMNSYSQQLERIVTALGEKGDLIR